MAAAKQGLDYYPRDVRVLSDKKFRKAKIKYGYLAIVVYDAVLEVVYSDKGYYADYGTEDEQTDLQWDISQNLNGKYPVEPSTVGEVIEMLVECRLFSHYHFKQGIITSQRIQSTYYRCTVERKNVEVLPEIWMLSADEMKAISNRSSILGFFENRPIMDENRPIINENRPKKKQSKVKESKKEESKEKENKELPCATEHSSAAPRPTKSNCEDIIQYFNNNTRSFAKVEIVTDARVRQLKILLGKFSYEQIFLAFKKAEDSDFLSGRNGKWLNCSFDWLIKTTNITKILEGNYDNRVRQDSALELYEIAAQMESERRQRGND